jgi:hypothetical protein
MTSWDVNSATIAGREKKSHLVAKIIRKFPAEEAQQALQDFKNLAATLGPLRKGVDARHVIRLLAASHYPNVRAFLRFLDEDWPSFVCCPISVSKKELMRSRRMRLRT